MLGRAEHYHMAVLPKGGRMDTRLVRWLLILALLSPLAHAQVSPLADSGPQQTGKGNWVLIQHSNPPVNCTGTNTGASVDSCAITVTATTGSTPAYIDVVTIESAIDRKST